ncbi:MAG: alpha-amylase family glycosyl hydrolase [bacterium]
MSILAEISSILKEETKQYTYYIPSLWLNKNKTELKNTKINPTECYSEIIDKILAQKKQNANYNQSLSLINEEKHEFPGDWTLNSTIYNIFVRLTTAYDHNNDGEIGGLISDITLNKEGIRETGTFLKTLAILPYLKELGINTIHLLPITSIGKDGNKGDLGSPYAIKNPYEIDKSLSDPLIYLPVEDQFKAFVEAAHILGMRVVLEFVLRTSSKDADWIKSHPDWFYWIDKNLSDKEYTSPEFTEEQLEKILEIPEGKGEYIAPNEKYKNFFKIPPNPEQIKYENNKYIAVKDNKELKIPGAFADWPPDDIQPAWSDVTYLRMYNYLYNKEENYNYIAYNTIRYYDPELAKPENANKELWTMIKNIIPHYQQEFGIDGVMIDMGHALPSELKQQMIDLARTNDSDFAFWDENFQVKQSSRNDGYNAVIGHTWAVEHEENGLQKIIEETTEELAIPFFGAAETHNTPRAASKEGCVLYSKLAWAVNNLIPNSVPFLHSGFEIGEIFPINTGLCFTPEELDYYKDKKLPLFYKSSYNWLNQDNIVEFIKKIALIRENNKDLIVNTNPKTIKILKTNNENVLAFQRISLELPQKKLLIILNTNINSSEKAEIELEYNKLNITLEKGEIVIL